MAVESVFQRITLLPIGSREYHGDRLPPETDAIIAEHVASAVANSLAESRVIRILPCVPFGVSTEHLGLPETVSVTPVSYLTFMRDILFTAAADGAELIVAINGHGGNTTLLSSLEGEFNYAHDRSKLFCPSVYPAPVKTLSKEILGEFDAHAGSVEASLLAYMLDWSSDEYDVDLGREMRGSLRFFRTRELNPLGVIKRLPTVRVDPLAGKRIAELIVSTVIEEILDVETRLSRVMAKSD